MENGILLLDPVFSHKIWGGNRLRTVIGYGEPGEDIGECWGVAAHPHGDCIVKNSIYQGYPLSQVYAMAPELFQAGRDEDFPFLVKIIDAAQDLSIQVHPDDAYARSHEHLNSGKTECWYVMDCPEEAYLIIGHNARSKEELEDMIAKNQWDQLLRKTPVKKGDFIQINPGTLHSITAGIMILETQQNSDITYRVYDFDRQVDGVYRTLHHRDSLNVLTVPAEGIEKQIWNTLHLSPEKLHCLIVSPYYQVYYLTTTKGFTCKRPGRFFAVSVIEGAGKIGDQEVQLGDHLIITSLMDQIEISGTMKLIGTCPV